MDRRIIRRFTLWLATGLVILGCAAPALVATPLPPDSGSFESIVAQTAFAAQTQTARVLPPTATPSLIPSPSKTPTITPTPTATVLFLFPTNTPLPTGIFGDDGDGNGDGSGDGNGDGDGYVKPTATPSEWTCRVLYRYPARGATVTAGRDLRATWTVQNTGTKSWPKKGVDVVYESGARLNYGKPYYDIPAAVGPGGTVRISVVMEIPKRPKEYNMRWSLKVGRTNFCSVQFVFQSK